MTDSPSDFSGHSLLIDFSVAAAVSSLMNLHKHFDGGALTKEMQGPDLPQSASASQGPETFPQTNDTH